MATADKHRQRSHYSYNQNRANMQNLDRHTAFKQQDRLTRKMAETAVAVLNEARNPSRDRGQ